MDFQGINARIDRANKQIETLGPDIDELCSGIRRSIVHEIDRDAGEQRWIYRGATPEIPIEWAIRSGEILYNLRSALDYTVWQLVLANEEKPTRDTQFPILDKEADWTNRKTERNLKGVAEKHKKTIRFLQPFNPFLQLPVNGEIRPFNAKVFRTLRELCNVDKHRHLNLILAWATGIEPIAFGVNHPPLRCSSAPLEGKGKRGPIKQDMVLLTFNDVEQEMIPRFVIDVRFGETEPYTLTRVSVVEQLRECLEAVQGGCALFRKA